MSLRRFPVCVGVVLAIAAAAGCADEPSSDPDLPKVDVETSPDPTLKDDSVVDFGVSLVGKQVNKTITIRNHEILPATVEVRGLDSPFGSTYPYTSLEVRPEGFLTFVLTFEPEEKGAAAAQVSIEIRIGDRSKRIPILLVGTGVEPSFVCDPGPLDFGRVNGFRSLSWRCENRTKLPVWVRLEGADRADVFVAWIVPQSGGITRSMEVRAGESIVVEVQFLSRTPGPVQATLDLVEEAGAPLGTVELRAVSVDGLLVAEPEDCLDFGDVPIGGTAERTLTLTDTSGSTWDLDVTAGPESDDEFFVTGSATLFLHAFESLSIPVTFRPREPGERTSALLVQRGWGWDQPLEICVRGVGHGPHLSCSGATEFPETVVGLTRTQRLLCTSDGFFRDDEVESALQVSAVRTAGSAFRAAVVGGIRPGGYSSGEAFELDVTFAPGAGGVHEGVVSLLTASAPGGSFDLPVGGSAVVLPPCTVEIAPQFVDFGIVPPGVTSHVYVGIANRSSGPCRLMGLRLSGDSDPSFSLGATGDLTIEPEAWVEVPVTFAAPLEGGYRTARLSFDVSDPRDPHREIPIEGTSEAPCLSFSPDRLLFLAELGCSVPNQAVAIQSCPGARIESIEVEAGLGAPSYFLAGVPPMPAILDGEGLEFAVGFSPQPPWTPFDGAVLVRDGQGVHRIPLEGMLMKRPGGDCPDDREGAR